MKLFCKDITQLPDSGTIERWCRDGEHFVLKFPKNIREEKANIITLLKNQLPENFSVFNSGGDSESEWITIMPVISRDIIDENEILIRASIADYIDTCNELMNGLETNLNDISNAWNKLLDGEASDYVTLFNELMDELETDPKISKAWNIFRHGQHIRFINKNSGQIVEVPVLGISRIIEVDPYFWGHFVESTEKYSSINRLIKDKFHDSARILEHLTLKERNRINDIFEDISDE